MMICVAAQKRRRLKSYYTHANKKIKQEAEIKKVSTSETPCSTHIFFFFIEDGSAVIASIQIM